jgi:hypothetical protein
MSYSQAQELQASSHFARADEEAASRLAAVKLSQPDGGNDAFVVSPATTAAGKQPSRQTLSGRALLGFVHDIAVAAFWDIKLLSGSLCMLFFQRVEALPQDLSDAANFAPLLALQSIDRFVTERLQAKLGHAEETHVKMQKETQKETPKEHADIEIITQSLLEFFFQSDMSLQSLGLLYVDAAKQRYGHALRDIQIKTAMPNTFAARFLATWEAKKRTHKICLLLHGSPEHNIDSILEHGVRGRAACNTRWLTSCPHTAAGYARGAQRMVVCATLLPKFGVADGSNIYTIDRDEHHLPLFVAERAV